MAYLLDTSVAILLRDNDERALSQLVDLDSVPFLSAVSRVELEGGVFADPKLTKFRRQALSELIIDLGELDFTSEMAEIYGRIVADLGFSRRQIIDRMIAATALVHDLTLITTNAGDFREIAGLKWKNWND